MMDGMTVIRIFMDKKGAACVEQMTNDLDFDQTQRVIACLEMAKFMICKNMDVRDMPNDMVDDTRKLLDG